MAAVCHTFDIMIFDDSDKLKVPMRNYDTYEIKTFDLRRELLFAIIYLR